jgi:hypothetical protein
MARCVAYLIALRNRKRRICDDFDRFENFLLNAMKDADLKTIEHGRYTVRRVASPVVACRSCGAEKTRPADAPEDFTPERLEIRTKREWENVA